ncbi:hypothetical protein BG015_004743 [Linnemannia schmuckeri]|uniref:Kelch repeat protein n=1 Tax=Linnemannia schmuckeri TaxID=64567 RepID=A0A9P5R8Y7_9FUNG|nr:hypothetical protein BG015_004743 [Linnemannia schmuckeri]
MIVFCGAGLNEIAKADIHILDFPTSTWTIGKPVEGKQARTNMTCAVSRDSFVAWGGESGQVNMDGVPIVYDIRNNQWTIQFKHNTGADAPGLLSSPSRSTAVPGSAESTINIATIGGGIAGALVVIALIGFFVYRRHITGRKAMGDNKNKDTVVGPTVREPQNPGGDPEAELLGSLYPSSLPSSYSRPKYYEHGQFFRLLAASPIAGPHSSMKNPQGQQGQQQQ